MSAAESAGARYLDFNDLLCSEQTCQPYVSGDFVYLDEFHLSLGGSEVLGRALIDRPEFREVFAPFATLSPSTGEPAWNAETIDWPENDYLAAIAEEAGVAFDRGSALLLADRDADRYALFGADEAVVEVPEGARLALRIDVDGVEAGAEPLVRLLSEDRRFFDFLFGEEPGSADVRRDAASSFGTELFAVTRAFETSASLRILIYPAVRLSDDAGYDVEAVGRVRIERLDTAVLPGNGDGFGANRPGL